MNQIDVPFTREESEQTRRDGREIAAIPNGLVPMQV